MAVTVQDVLRANIVFVGVELLNAPGALERFRALVDSEVVQEGVLIAQTPNTSATQGRLLRLAKDRILLETSQIRSSVSREYPDKTELHRLSEVTKFALDNTSLETQSPQAFGFNVELTYDQESGLSAQQYLARRLFSPALSVGQNRHLVGGSGKFIFEVDSRHLTFSIEPRFNEQNTSKVFLTLNSHFSENRVPSSNEILETLADTWDRVHAFAAEIDDAEC